MYLQKGTLHRPQMLSKQNVNKNCFPGLSFQNRIINAQNAFESVRNSNIYILIPIWLHLSGIKIVYFQKSKSPIDRQLLTEEPQLGPT